MTWAIGEEYLSVIGSKARIRLDDIVARRSAKTASTQLILTMLFLKRGGITSKNGVCQYIW